MNQHPPSSTVPLGSSQSPVQPQYVPAQLGVAVQLPGSGQPHPGATPGAGQPYPHGAYPQGQVPQPPPGPYPPGAYPPGQVPMAQPGMYPPGAYPPGQVPMGQPGAYPQGQVPHQAMPQHPPSGPVPQPPRRMDELQTGGARTVFEFTGAHAKSEPGKGTFIGSLDSMPDLSRERPERMSSNLSRGLPTWVIVLFALGVVGGGGYAAYAAFANSAV